MVSLSSLMPLKPRSISRCVTTVDIWCDLSRLSSNVMTHMLLLNSLALQDFYEDVFEEVAQFGEIENLNICDNLADHMVGNVYVKFRDETAAAAALQALTGRYYNGRPIMAEFSPVTDFREATCRQYEENTCGRGGYCNFMHLKPISRDLRKHLFGRYKRRDDERR